MVQLLEDGFRHRALVVSAKAVAWMLIAFAVATFSEQPGGTSRLVARAQEVPSPTGFCTVLYDCSDHATSVEFRDGACQCDCYNQWRGSECQNCPENFTLTNCSECNAAKGYGGTYPNCVAQACTGPEDCNFNGLPVGGNKADGCQCQCFQGTGWTGSTCNICPARYDQTSCTACAPGYRPFPECYFVCTIPDNCTNHAKTVSGDSNTGCSCECENAWFGTACDECPDGTNATLDCAACNTGFEDFPNCSRSCTLADCGNNNNTINVRGTERTGCECICRNQFTGPNCTECPSIYDESLQCGACAPAFGGYPNCSLKCTEANCSNNAINVEGTSSTGCTCTCRNQWRGDNCSECRAGFNASSDCNSCLSGYSGSDCRRECTPAIDCNGHASSATGYEGDCTCNCRNGWRGDTCDSCTSPYSGEDCDICVPGFIGTPPACKKNCSVRADCSGHATEVEGFLNGTCKCDCRFAWSNASCDFCPPNFNEEVDCSACAEGYEQYPNCYLKCTNQFNCTGRAKNVTGNSKTGCTCVCDNQWTGATCSVCPDVYDPEDCDRCATGYVDYPTCARECTSRIDCNDHAANVTGGFPNCTCTCRHYWTGSRCETCPTQYDSDRDCNACDPRYELFPDCYLKCTNIDNCTNHADAVSGNIVDGCNCTCSNEWFGANCSQCPPLVDANEDCGKCIAGYAGYPNCQRICTEAEDCSDHATGVSGLEGNCTCTCRNEWSNSTCDVCNRVFFNETQDCGKCIDAREDYPDCYLKCTIPANCSDHATAVTGNDGPDGCTCTCRNQWHGDECTLCDDNFNSTEDCGACAEGYDDYPRCSRICTNVTDCSGHAANVSGLFPDCDCTCRNAWFGESCEYCPDNFEPESDCTACADGYEGFFPDCYLICTQEANCSDHAVNVRGNSNTGCNCTCRNQWNGTECDECADVYDNSTQADCGVCAFGYEGYPDCVRTCTISLDCNGHADNITGTYPNCTCGCRNQWYGDKCQRCDPIYNNQSDCGTCARGFDDYPHCFPKCTSALNCSGHAQRVTGNFNTTCNCTCRASWYGEKCDQCPENMDPENDCAACKFGYLNYPICAPRCGNSDCMNRSLSVSGAFPNCTCNCKHFWSDESLCKECPVNYNVTNDCDGCAENYTEYPNCYRECTNDLDCAGNAFPNVTGNIGPLGCTCTCRNFWNVSTNCSTCPVNYNASLDCNACADGYADYPRCTRICTSLEDCNNNAVNVSGLEGNCTCGCRNQWQNATCDYCPPNFVAGLDCGVCARYHENYPNCTLIVSATLEDTFSASASESESNTVTVTTTMSGSRTVLPTPTASLSRAANSSTPTFASPSRTMTLRPVPTPTATHVVVTNTGTETLRPTRTRTVSSLPTRTQTFHVITPTETLPPPRTATAEATHSGPGRTASMPKTPSATLRPTATVTLPLTRSHAKTRTVTLAPMRTATVVLCRDEWECNGRGNASDATTPGEEAGCSCTCQRGWTSPTRVFPLHERDGCTVCPERFNESANCASCANDVVNGSLFPGNCRFSAHIVGNWTLRYCDDPRAKTLPYLDALAKDLEDAIAASLTPRFLNDVTTATTALPGTFGQTLPYGCPFPLPQSALWRDVPTDERLRVVPSPTNPAAYGIRGVKVLKLSTLFNNETATGFEGQFKRVALFDVEIFSTSLYGVEGAADCVAAALDTDEGAIGTALTADLAPAAKSPVMPARWTLAHTAAFLGRRASQECITGSAGFVANSSNFTACFPIGCGAPIDDSAVTSPAEAAAAFPLWIIFAAVAGLLVLGAAIFLILRFAVPSVGKKVLPSRFFVDGTKYTVAFEFQDEMDDEMRLMTAEREIDFDDI